MTRQSRTWEIDRRVFWVAVAICCVALCAGSANVLLERSALRAATENGKLKDFHETTEEELERDVQSNLPLGSTRAFVEEFLSKEGMQFSFDPASRTIYAGARYIKGSNFLTYKSLGFKFKFDEASALQSIDSAVKLTGP